MEIGITIRHTAWQTALPEARRVTRKAALAALALTTDLPAAASQAARPQATELAVVLADDALLHALNKEYRGIDKATNVLAFAYAESESESAPAFEENDVLGDVVIAFETARAEADQAERGLSAHLSHLVIHGVLHLLGYDHENDRDAEAMEDLEIQALAAIGISNPYASLSAEKTTGTVTET
jgi:probable rRNA maturation factor